MSKTTKKKNYYYVLVFTNNGPKFVTKCDWERREAHWDVNEKPLELGKSVAEDLTFGLRCNMYTAFTVYLPYEISSHGYNYEDFEIKFVEKEESEDK